MDYFAARIESRIINFSLGAPKEPVCALDLMTTRQPGKKRRRGPNRKAIARNIRRFLEVQIAAQKELQRQWT